MEIKGKLWSLHISGENDVSVKLCLHDSMGGTVKMSAGSVECTGSKKVDSHAV